MLNAKYEDGFNDIGFMSDVILNVVSRLLSVRFARLFVLYCIIESNGKNIVLSVSEIVHAS